MPAMPAMPRTPPARSLAAAAALLSVLSASSAASAQPGGGPGGGPGDGPGPDAEPGIVALGTLPGGNNISRARAVSDDGRVVYGEAVTADVRIVPFRWTAAAGFEALPTMPDTWNYRIRGTSPDGSWVAGSVTSPGPVSPEGFIWSDATGYIRVGDLPGGHERSEIYVVTDAGVGYGVGRGTDADENETSRAVRWTPSGGLETVPLPAADEPIGGGIALGELPDGRLVGRSPSGVWLYHPSDGHEVLTDARILGLFNSDATFLAGNGTDFDVLANRAMYWTPQAGPVFLPPPSLTQLSSMDADGSVILGRESIEAVVWIDQGEPRRIEDYAASRGIDMDGWNVIHITDESADGRTIVGEAVNTAWAMGRLEAVVITLPGPCTADTNGDGLLTPEDFFAWVQAFTAQSPACDQNDDGLCDSADFFAWVVGYAQGCQ